MKGALVSIVLSMLLLANCKGKLQKKGLVVEVQSHNQAMKSANPITDLEQTISQGMNDPFTDPKFVMNRINDEFFGDGLKSNIKAGTPMVENNLHNRELLAFRNLGFNAQSLNLASKLLSDPVTQHAIKENTVPVQKPVLASSRGNMFPNSNKLMNLLGMKKHLAVSPISSIQKLPMEPKIPSNLNIAEVSAESIQSTSGGATTGANRQEMTIPPASDSTIQASQSNVESTPQNIGDTLSSILSQKGARSSDILTGNPGSISGQELEDNFSSIKAFLEADNSLRQKKVLDPVTNPLEDLMHKKHHVPKAIKSKSVHEE